MRNPTPGIQWYKFRPPGVTPNRGMGPPPWGAFCQISLISCCYYLYACHYARYCDVTVTSVIQPVKCVCDLGVHLDSELTMKTHISKVVSACFYQLRKIRQVCRVVEQDVTQQLVSAFVLSRLDYCNSLLSGLPRSTIQPLQRVMNAAARVVMALSTRDHVKLALKQLHWLPVEQRISYKLHISRMSSDALHPYRSGSTISE